MADTDSNASDATLPPLPSTVAQFPRTNHLHPQPVASRVYQAIADVNGGFEKLTQNLQSLEQFNFFPADILTWWLNSVQNLQAMANSHLLESVHSREMNNGAYYDRLCRQWFKENIEDPNDVLLEAEYRKHELADERKQDDIQE